MNPAAHRGYWCECWTQSPATGNAPVLLASFDAHTATQAVRWIRVALRTVASALEAETRLRAWDWLTTGHTTATYLLTHNEPCSVAISHADTRIEWTARPVLFLPLAHRHGRELPPCAGEFARGPATN